MAKPCGVVGLDLSLRSTGACYVPRSWGGDPARVKVAGWGRDSDGTPGDKAERLSEIASGVLAFVAQHVSPGGSVWAEEYAHAMAGQANAAALRELGGAVKLKLWEELGVVVEMVPATSARKTLFGRSKLPRKGAKEAAHERLDALGGSVLYWNADQKDAFVICNFALVQNGWTALTLDSG